MRASSEDPEGGKSKKFCQKISQRSQIPENVVFRISQNFSLESPI